ncbi:SH3 domain-containing protein [Aureimonas psammosilenae]|uniref:SH3 domain-containing protein n=1 Tax=Aureimonas psammosilenae TaxID=2495496 RepID=UPI00186A5938|nr:SH3 domain-containing protein [Aureimonas psammosilenae]
MVRRILKSLALGLGLALTAGAASAATSAVVTNDLNIRTGPAANYQRYGTIPAGDEVRVYGCLRGYNWCDVGWNGERGWVHGAYLAYLGRQYYRQTIPRVAVRVGVPVYGFDPYDYHRRYYTGRSWYRDRYLDRGGYDRDRYERRDFGRDADRLRRERDRREAFRDGPPPPPPVVYDDDGRGPPPPYGGPGRYERDGDRYDNDRFDPRRRYLDE